MSRDVNIEVPRDGHYQSGWHLTDSEGADLDLTGHSITAAAQYAAGSNPVIASATIDLYDPTHGKFDMTWAGVDFSAVEGSTEIVRLSWKLRDTDPGGFTRDIVRGQIVLIPENS